MMLGVFQEQKGSGGNVVNAGVELKVCMISGTQFIIL